MDNYNNTNQIIRVKGNRLVLYNKINSTWIKEIETDCVYGKNGYSANRKEGDNTTPIGIFPLLYAFGTEDNPGTKVEYRKITEKSYYSLGNKWVESNCPVQGEHLIDYKKEYHYGIVIGFNINPVVKGKGSAIFLHCKGENEYTAGCIAVEDKMMLEILKKLDIGAYIEIQPF